MPLPYIAISFFVLAALILLWLGRNSRMIAARERKIAPGMNEAEVLSLLGPPKEIRREGDPLDASFFAEGIRASFVYPGGFLVRFARGIVIEVGEDSPLPVVDAEPVRPRPRELPSALRGRTIAAAPASGSLPLDEVEEVDTVPLDEDFPAKVIIE